MRLRWTEELKTRFAEAVEQGGGLHHVCITPSLAAHVQSLARSACHPRTRSPWHTLAWSATHVIANVRYQTSALPACSRRLPGTDAATLLLWLQATAQQILVHMSVPELTIAHVKSHLQQERMHHKYQLAEHHPYGSDSRQASEGAVDLCLHAVCLL